MLATIYQNLCQQAQIIYYGLPKHFNCYKTCASMLQVFIKHVCTRAKLLPNSCNIFCKHVTNYLPRTCTYLPRVPQVLANCLPKYCKTVLRIAKCLLDKCNMLPHIYNTCNIIQRCSKAEVFLWTMKMKRIMLGFHH